MLLYEVVDIFHREKLKYALIGGYALALHGIVRATMDVDFVLALKQPDYVCAEKALGTIGLRSRLPIRAEDVIKMRLEYINNRNLLAWSFVDYGNPTRQVDILITEDLRKLKVETVSVGGRKISVATLKEILRLKKIAQRPQDLVDIKNIEEKLSGKK